MSRRTITAKAPTIPSMNRTRSNSSSDRGCVAGCKDSCWRKDVTKANPKEGCCYRCFGPRTVKNYPYGYGSKVIKRKSKKLRGSKKKRGKKSVKRRGSKKRRGRKSVKRRGMKKRRK